MREKASKRLAQLEAIRLATKAAKSSLSSCANGQKKQALMAEFEQRMVECKKCVPDAIKRMPRLVQLSFVEVP